jgi:hypothetical protein
LCAFATRQIVADEYLGLSGFKRAALSLKMPNDAAQTEKTIKDARFAGTGH